MARWHYWFTLDFGLPNVNPVGTIYEIEIDRQLTPLEKTNLINRFRIIDEKEVK